MSITINRSKKVRKKSQKVRKKLQKVRNKNEKVRIKSLKFSKQIQISLRRRLQNASPFLHTPLKSRLPRLNRRDLLSTPALERAAHGLSRTKERHYEKGC